MKNILSLKFIWLAFPFVLFSCSPKEASTVLLPELQQAEAIMYARPDSALTILKQMPVPPAWDRLQNATWCLLMTQAEYKNFIDQPSDSLIDIACDYFMDQDDPQRKAMALYYKGALNKEKNNVEEALRCYLNAAKYIEETTDYQLSYLIYIGMAEIYAYRKLVEYGLKACEEAHRYAGLLGDKGCIAASLIYSARIYTTKNEWEKSIIFYKKALKTMEDENDLVAFSTVLCEIASAYCHIEKYDLAVNYAKDALYITSKEEIDSDQVLLTIGGIYKQKEKYDSAYYYLNQAALSRNIYTECTAYYTLYSLSKEEKKYAQALEYNDKYQHCSDSIQEFDRSKALVEMQEKYNQEKVTNEKNQLIIKNDRIVRNALLGGLFLLTIIACLIYIYQRKLVKKERTIKENEELIRLHTLKIHENEALIERNESRIEELSAEIEQNQGAQEQVEELQMVITDIKKANHSLRTDNETLQDNIAHYSTAMQEKGKLLNSVKTLSEEVLRLKGREKFLCDQLTKKTDVLNKLKRKPKHLDIIQWEEVREAIDYLYDNFTTRLKNEFPSITDGELRICCLVKLHISVADMGLILGISSTSVSRNKLRLKEHIIQDLGRALDENQTLDLWIWEY